MAEKLLRANKGYTLFSLRTGEVVARLRTIGQDDRVQVLWCCHDAWGNQVSFGCGVMPLDEALQFVATKGFFWIYASGQTRHGTC